MRQGEKHPVSEPYTDVIYFDQEESISLFQNWNYKVRILIGHTPSVMGLVTCVLDTGGGPNLIYSRFIPRGWKEWINPVDDPRLLSTSCQALSVMGSLLLYVRMGDLQIRT